MRERFCFLIVTGLLIPAALAGPRERIRASGDASLRLPGEIAQANPGDSNRGEEESPGIQELFRRPFIAIVTDGLSAMKGDASIRFQDYPFNAELEPGRAAFANYLSASLALARDQFDEANQILAKARAGRPDEPAIPIAIARARLDHRDPQGAIALAGEVLTSRPDSFDAHVVIADAHQAQLEGADRAVHHAEAVKHFEAARQLQPLNLQALEPLGRLYWEEIPGKRDPGERDALMDHIIEVYGSIFKAVTGRNRLIPLLVLASSHQAKNQNDKAEECFKKAIEVDPRNVRTYLMLADLYQETGKKDEAVASYRQALVLEPLNGEAQKGADAALAAQSPAAQIKFYGELTRDFPHNPEYAKLYAQRLVWNGKLADAAQAYSVLLKASADDIESRLLLIPLLVQLSRADEAIPHLREAESQSGGSPDLLSLLAGFWAQLNNGPEAERLFQAAIETAPPGQKPKHLLALTRYYFGAQRPEAAAPLLRQLETLRPDDPALLAVVASFYQQAKKDSEAERVFRRAIEVSDVAEKPERMLDLAGFLIRAKRAADAVVLLKEIEALRPGDAAMLAEVGGRYIEAEMGPEAERLFRSAVEKAPESEKPRYLRRLAASLANRSDLGGAVEAIRSAMKIRPNDPSNYYLLSWFYVDNKRMEDALAVLDEGIQALGASQRQDLQEQRASVLEIMGRKDEALAALALARERSEGEKRFQLDLKRAEILGDLERYDEAERILKELQKETDGSPLQELALLHLAMNYSRSNRSGDAESVYHSLIEKNPRNAQAYIGLGMIYDNTNRIDKAEEMYRRVMDLDPKNADAYNNLGYMLASRGVRLQEARTLIEKALEIEPAAAHIMDSMGWVLYQAGDYKAAAEELEKAVKSLDGDKADAEVYEHLGDAYTKMGRADKAEEAYRKGSALDADRKSLTERLGALKP